MTETKNLTSDEAASELDRLVGEYAWWVRCTDYRILQIEFGDPHLRVQGPWPIPHPSSKQIHSAMSRRLVLPTGSWSLFVENGLWAVQALGLACSRSDSTQEELELCLNRLDGQRVISAKTDMGQSTLVLKFDLEGTLTVALNPDAQDSDQWTLFQQSGTAVSYLTSGQIEAEEVDQAEQL